MSEYLIKVKPGSSQEKIAQTGPSEFTVYLRAKPHDGEANTALIGFLAKHFKVAKTSIKILRGHKSHTKLVQF